mmetsp:Transcript_60770/g.170296  ORF Transcript_60770/g.170296 Transcript_60770/m.170296 type:complete len:213 (-) Transcript_60770:753-1391(-)
MPISLALLTALKASLYRSFLSFTSVSVAPPTLIFATPPPSAAMRSVSLSISKALVVSLISDSSCAMRAATASACAPSLTTIAFSFSTTTLSQVPSCPTVASFNVMPSSELINSAPVATAMSWRIAALRFPNDGALIATTSTTPRCLLSTSVCKASPEMSSAMMNNGCFAETSASNKFMMSYTSVSLWSVTNTRGFSSSATERCMSVTKYGEM